MSNATIPKEKQTAYQRWELSSFAEDKPRQPMAVAKTPQEKEADSAKLAQMIEKLRQEGYAKGLEEGYAAGMAQALEQAQAEREQLQVLLDSLTEAMSASDEAVGEQLLSLALDLAKAMLKTKIEVDPTAVLSVVKDAIHYLPYVQRPARILVHPEDVKTLKNYLVDDIAEHHWMIQEDRNVERGGCIVETAANQIDATNEVRWKRIADALSQQNDWLK